LVVELLQCKDLYSIDEDLNGRMFEVFLSAIVRGKNLGAYFTPRSIVESMVKMADLQVKKKDGDIYIDKVLDGCCGSGGFLIDAMAEMMHRLSNNKTLQSDFDEIKKKIMTESIYGIEKNPSISRIARINMYVHGNGGSKIYCADTLDKDLLIEDGERKVSKVEVEELKKVLVDENLKFDVILTNPPFAMSYSKKEEHEARILTQYGTNDPNENISYKKGTNDIKSSVKSNILFLARYSELLRKGGKLLIVLDNSVFNSSSHKEYREWIKANFIIKAVISLPKYSFIHSGAGGVTSILYLKKRKTEKQKQTHVFARTVQYTGISKSGKEIFEDDLPDVAEEYLKFEETGKLYLHGKDKIGDFDEDRLFLIPPDDLSDRIDVAFHAPSYKKLLENLKQMEKEGKIKLKKVKDFEKIDSVDKEKDGGNLFSYADIGVLNKERGEMLIEECEEGLLEMLPERANLQVTANDLIFPLSYDSFGKVAIIPPEFDNQLVSSGFYGFKFDSYEEACLVWNIIRSEYVQKQFIHVASGYTQREISKTNLKKHIVFPIPAINVDELKKETVVKIEEAKKAREQELALYKSLNEIFEDHIK
jgi:type I restriction enzyme M protein